MNNKSFPSFIFSLFAVVFCFILVVNVFLSIRAGANTLTFDYFLSVLSNAPDMTVYFSDFSSWLNTTVISTDSAIINKVLSVLVIPLKLFVLIGTGEAQILAYLFYFVKYLFLM